MSTSTNKGYELQATGTNFGTWGGILNSNFSIIDLNFGGYLTKSVAGSSNVTVTDEEAEYVRHELTGVLTGNIKYILPNVGSFYFIKNSTTGAFTLTAVSDAGGSGILIPQGSTVMVFVNSGVTTVVQALDYFTTLTAGTLNVTTLNFSGTLAVNQGGTGAATLAQYQVLLGNGTSAVQTVTGTGTLGQLLTSNGAAANPTWQTPAAVSGTPTGAILDFGGSTAPSGYLLCYGQDVSRATYSDLFGVIGTTYGSGDGTTTFTLPDCRGRVGAGKDDMGGVAAGRITNAVSGIDGTVLGAAGGAQSITLSSSQIPNFSIDVLTVAQGSGTNHAAGTRPTGANTATTGGSANSGAATFSGGGQAHANVQPTIIFTKIIKV